MKITIKKKSTLTGINNTMEVEMTKFQFERYKLRKEYIQDICPELDRDTREFLISGITPEEWNNAFGTDEETDEL